MDVRVRFIGMPYDAKAARAMTRRVLFALDRLAPSLRRVVVALRDENGPRGGIDQHCTLHVVLRGGGRPIIARATRESPDEAVAVALGRARRRLSRRLPTRSLSAA